MVKFVQNSHYYHDVVSKILDIFLLSRKGKCAANDSLERECSLAFDAQYEISTKQSGSNKVTINNAGIYRAI